MAPLRVRKRESTGIPHSPLCPQVVVRHLPPMLPEAVLLQVLAPYRADFDEFYYIVGDPT